MNNGEMEAAINPTLIRKLLPEVAWLNDREGEMLRLVIELCDVNSGTHNLPGLAAVADLLQREFRCLDGELEFVEIEPQFDVNEHGQETSRPLGRLLHIQKRFETRPRILLCIHMDTVYPADHVFDKCVELPNGNINGPGVADAKGGLVIMLYALKALERSQYADQIGWEVIINPDEELGSPGSETFLKSRARDADVGLLFEPALPDGTLVSWRKGVGNFAFIVRGNSVHAGREFEKGRNAIVECCRLMDDVHKLNVDPDVTYNVGRICGGSALNVVPDLSIGRVNVRVKTRAQMDQVKSQFEKLAEKYSQLDGFEIELAGRFSSPPKEINASIERLQQHVEQCGQVLGQKIRWQGTGGASDGNKFASVGLPNIDTLGPIGGNLHSDCEYLLPSSLVARAQLAALVMLSYGIGNGVKR